MTDFLASSYPGDLFVSITIGCVRRTGTTSAITGPPQ